MQHRKKLLFADIVEDDAKKYSKSRLKAFQIIENVSAQNKQEISAEKMCIQYSAEKTILMMGFDIHKAFIFSPVRVRQYEQRGGPLCENFVYT
jgi:hypothetical protein